MLFLRVISVVLLVKCSSFLVDGAKPNHSSYSRRHIEKIIELLRIVNYSIVRLCLQHYLYFCCISTINRSHNCFVNLRRRINHNINHLTFNYTILLLYIFREPTVPRTPPFGEVINLEISLLEGRGSGNLSKAKGSLT